MSRVRGEAIDTRLAGSPSITSRIAWTASATFFVIVPVAILIAHFSDAVILGQAGYDFTTYYAAAEALLRSGTPYVPIDVAAIGAGTQYVYPPLTAIAVTPLTALSQESAGLFMGVLLLVVVLCIPLVLGVRDWRCVGLVVLWPPTVQALQTGNVTIFLALAAALAWRFRDRAPGAGLAVGSAFAIKFMLAPLVVWLGATRRYAAVAWAVGCASVLLVGSWAAIAFDGLGTYPDMLRELTRIMDDRAYSLYAVVLDLGAPSELARLAWLALGVALLVGTVVAGRRGDDRLAFALGLTATLALSPIVWLETFVFLVPVVALAQPSLGIVWLVPLSMWITGGTHAPTTFEATGTLVVAALTVALALRALRRKYGHTSRRAGEIVMEAT